MITISHLTKYYGSNLALDDINMLIPHNSIYGIVGPNGAGKSTLLKILTQILDYDSGTIVYNSGITRESLRKQLGYLPEQRGLYSGLDIETQLSYFSKIRGASCREARNSVNYWLKKFDINSWRKRRVSELSKGMQQKVQFISCLIGYPKYIFMDEPLSGIDPVNFKYFVDIVKDYRREYEATIMLATHNMKSVEKLCTNVAFIMDAKIIADGSVNDVVHSYASDDTYEMVVRHSNTECFDKESFLIRLPAGYRLLQTETSGCISKILLQSYSTQGASSTKLQDLLKYYADFDILSITIKQPSIEEIFIKLENLSKSRV